MGTSDYSEVATVSQELSDKVEEMMTEFCEIAEKYDLVVTFSDSTWKRDKTFETEHLEVNLCFEEMEHFQYIMEVVNGILG